MTQREQELFGTAAEVIQKAERLAESVSKWEWTETAYRAIHSEPIGSEVWSQHVAAIKEAELAVKHDRIILHAAIREAKDTLYHEKEKAA